MAWAAQRDVASASAAGGEGKVSFRVLHMLEFRDGKISRENVWMDLATIMKQLGQAST